MSRATAALGTALFFVVAPGTALGLIPWWLTGWQMREPIPYWLPAQIAGGITIGAGSIVLVHVFVRFVLEGVGTPAPIAPTQHLVVGGFNRYVRNPIYVALLAVILGEALLLGQLVLLVYAVIAWIIPAVFVHWYEEPALTRQFGAEYEAYRRAVPAWLPRLHPWNPDQDSTQY